MKTQPEIRGRFASAESFSYIEVNSRWIHECFLCFRSPKRLWRPRILTAYPTIRVLNLIQIYNSILIMLDIFQVLVYFVIQKLNAIRIYNFLHLLCRVLVQHSFLAGPKKHDGVCSPKKASSLQVNICKSILRIKRLSYLFTGGH